MNKLETYKLLPIIKEGLLMQWSPSA